MLRFLEAKARGLFCIVLAWADLKDRLSAKFHISHWTIHFALGIALLFIVGRLMRKPLTSAAPLIPIAVLEFLNELLDFLPVELMISQDINYRLITERLENPFYPVGASVNIAREHNHVGIHFVFLERRKLQMEIA